MGFESYQLHEKLKQLWQDRITGTLTCAIKGYEKKLFLKDGLVCFATSTDPEDKLPSVLVRQGRFSEDQFRSAEPNFNDKISIGRNLIEMGLITQSELVEGAKEQIYTVFASCMLAETGSEQFEEGPLPSGIVSLPLKYPRDFFRSILAMHDKVWISSQFGNALSFVPTPNPDKRLDFNKLEIDEFAEPVYKLIDGELNFNHLTFEAEIDDFMLLKYLYALHFLDYISIEADENEPEPEVESVLEDLGRAMEQSEQVERLKNEVDLNGMSMEDTVALPAMKGKVTPPSGSMDVTMEISRDVLGSTPLGELFGEEASDTDQDEEEDEDEAPKSPLISGFEAFDEDEEEAGLDDLAALSPDFLEQELQRGEPLGYVPEGVIMPDPEGEDPSAEEEVAKTRPSNRRLLLMTATGLTLVGLLMTFRPYLEGMDPFGPGAAKLETEQQASEPETQIEEPLQAEPITSESETQAVDANPEATPADNAQATETQTTPSAPPEVQTSVPLEKQAAIDPPVQEPPKATNSAPKLSTKAAVPAYRSPIAEAWDPKTNRPRGQSQAPLGDAIINDEASLSPGSQTTTPTTLTSSTPPAPRTSTSENKSQAPPKKLAQNEPGVETRPKPLAVSPPLNQADQPNAELVPITSAPKTESPKPSTTAPESLAEAQRLFADQRYNEAAKLWKQRINTNQYTFAVSDVCGPEAIAQARRAIGADPRLFLLPNARRGPDCFWLCWGTYDKRVEAILARKELPEGFASTRSEAIALKTLLK